MPTYLQGKHAPPPPSNTRKALAAPALCLCIHMSTLFGSKLQTPSLNTSVCLSVGMGTLLTTNHLKRINRNRRGRDLGVVGTSAWYHSLKPEALYGAIQWKPPLWFFSPAGHQGEDRQMLGLESPS